MLSLGDGSLLGSPYRDGTLGYPSKLSELGALTLFGFGFSLSKSNSSGSSGSASTTLSGSSGSFGPAHQYIATLLR
eukprot:9948790-Heterocapsa_arctica.AAC.1